MAEGKILAVCQSGGEFVTNDDGSMSYNGGEAHAMDVHRDMLLDDFKLELATMFDRDPKTFSIKYFLLDNKRTLISVSNDKDLQRMVDFNASSVTTDVYILDKVDKRATRSTVADWRIPADSGNPTTGTILPISADEDDKERRVSLAWENIITGVGQVFDNVKAFRDALHKYAIAKGFMYRFVKNDGVRVTARCCVDNCRWRIHATGKPKWIIKRMNDTHTCDGTSGKGRHLATQRWVASVIKDKLRDHRDYKPREIASDLHKEYGLTLNYWQAYHGKSLALKELNNSHEEANNQLPSFCERIVETNPGSIATFDSTDKSRFHRLFVCFHALLHGFEHGCRPLLFLEAISLKASKQWKLMAATAVDGDNGIFPVAFAVMEAVTSENWHWFLSKLKSALSMSRSMTFVSNKQNGLVEAVSQVFEDSYHGLCLSQLVEDLKTQLKETLTEEVKEGIINDLKQAAYAYKVDDFNACVECIKNVSNEAAEWVLSSKPECWSNSIFKGLWYNTLSFATVESFNNWVTNVSTNEPSVVQIVDMIRCMMMDMIYARRESSNTWAEMLTPSMSKKLQEESIKERTLEVMSSTGSMHEVRGNSDGDDYPINVVNTETQECTCRRWQVTGLPCVHAIAVIEHTNGCIHDYCSKYFTTECYRTTYSLSINPIPDIGNTVLYPRNRRQRGRPKRKAAELLLNLSKRTVQCSKCKEFGHNKAACRAAKK